jgi:glucan 1,3-beta-glucosidase
VALMLAGIASGAALAWQVRQMLYACGPLWEWLLSGAACAAALVTALMLARTLAAVVQGVTVASPSRRWRFGWLFVLAYYGLLLVFDGRYRDFPLGLFALPAVGYALVALAGVEPVGARRREEAFLAVAVSLLAAIVLAQELGISPAAWLWLGLNALPGLAVLLPPRRIAHQQHGADQ